MNFFGKLEREERRRKIDRNLLEVCCFRHGKCFANYDENLFDFLRRKWVVVGSEGRTRQWKRELQFAQSQWKARKLYIETFPFSFKFRICTIFPPHFFSCRRDRFLDWRFEITRTRSENPFRCQRKRKAILPLRCAHQKYLDLWSEIVLFNSQHPYPISLLAGPIEGKSLVTTSTIIYL